MHYELVSSRIHALAALSQAKFPVRTEQEAGWVPEPVWAFWRRENLLPLPEFEPWPSYHTDYSVFTTQSNTHTFYLETSTSFGLFESPMETTGCTPLTFWRWIFFFKF